MPTYVLTFHGESAPMPEDPAELEAMMQKWGAWYGSIGEALVDGGAPFGEASSVGPDGASTPNPAVMSGYTIITADDMAAATVIAQGSPVLESGHSVQISQCVDMS